MAIILRRASERGSYQTDWLDSRHTFSFGEYYDPAWMNYSDLRVLNQDRVGPGGAFGLHPHRDMEIVSYVLEGGLRHEDSMGHQSVVGPGGVQRISAGSGMRHSEANASDTEIVHFLQIWIPPRKLGSPPSYESVELPQRAREAGWTALASAGGIAGSVRIDQDARIDVTLLKKGGSRAWKPGKGRKAWVHVATGSVLLNGKPMAAGDGAAVEGEPELAFKAVADSEILVFDLR